jgi:hypothetical protein
VEHFFLFPLSDDLPLFQLQHVGDAVRNFLPVIGYVEKLGAGSADFFQDSQDSDPIRDIQAMTGLIYDQKNRRFHHGSSQENQAPLAVG